MGHKAVETTHNINNIFGPRTANERTMQWWFKKFCKGDKNPEDEECSGQPSEADNDQLRAIIKVNPLTATWEVVKEFNVDHSIVIQHLKQIGKMKKLDKWVPHELNENQKHHRFEVTSSFLCNNNEPFLDWIDMQQKVNSIGQPAITNSVAEPKRSFKALPKAKLAPNLGETITSEKYAQQIDEMYRKLKHLQLALINRKGRIMFVPIWFLSPLLQRNCSSWDIQQPPCF